MDLSSVSVQREFSVEKFETDIAFCFLLHCGLQNPVSVLVLSSLTAQKLAKNKSSQTELKHGVFEVSGRCVEHFGI